AQHAMGNQEGLIFSSFLGLSLVQPLNRLQVESSLARREAKIQEQRTEREIALAQEEVTAREKQLSSIREELAGLDRIQRDRQVAVRESDQAGRLADVMGLLLSKTSELRGMTDAVSEAS